MNRSKQLLLTLICCGLTAFGANSEPTPAERRVELARKAIQANPKSIRAHTELAMALARRARETSDTAYYAQADKAVRDSLAVAPGNIEALKVKAWILLGKHEFAHARQLALELNRRVPDDIMIYGLLVDANAELGNYKEAENAAQWMLDLRPGSVPGLTRAAYLREQFGDVEGALDLMGQAFQRMRPEESEERAWALAQASHLKVLAGDLTSAGRLASRALETFSDYHYALGALARVRAAEGRHADAVSLQRRRFSAAPHPENLYELAQVLERAGETAEAKRLYAQFEREARAEMASADNANRELAFYYADHARRPQEALKVARAEIARRQDVQTIEAYAWALHSTGEYRLAHEQIQKALAVGSRDPKLLGHAAAIERSLQKATRASR